MSTASQVQDTPFTAHRRKASHKFCPDAGLITAAGIEETATAEILASLLRPLALIMVLSTAAFSVRELWLGPDQQMTALGWLSAILVAIVGIPTVLLRNLTLRQLRRLEATLFVLMSTHLVAIQYDEMVARAQLGDPGLIIATWNMTALAFSLLMTAYALFIPNSWQRAALLIVPMSMVPLGLGAYVRATRPEIARLVEGTVDVRVISDVALVMAISAVVALLGVALITRFRSMTIAAHSANLYDLREKIGEGGMGEVWRAEHQTLARPAAIKIIRPELAGGDAAAARVAMRRFEREAQATAQLRSPNTVEIYDFGTTQAGAFYYVMEYLDGLDLETMVKLHGPLPAERVVHLVRQACASLADAHAHGLIHRDIKPANIYSCRMGQEVDFVKVLDFGLVKEQKSSTTTQLTVDGLTTGTPAYMAPEMALQDRPVGPGTDVYSLGCVAYWLLTGRLVFEGESPMSIVVDHVKSTPVPPSSRTELPVPAELDAIVMRCLEKDPAQRFGSMRELSEALSRVPLPGPWAGPRAEEWWQLHRPRRALEELARAS